MNTFEIGDTIICEDIESPLFKRECVVVFVDTLVTGVITEGVKHVTYMKPETPGIKIIKKGIGVLTAENKQLAKKVLEQSGALALSKNLCATAINSKKFLGMDSEESVYIEIKGFVSKPMALVWKQLNAQFDLSREVNPDIDPKIKERFMELAMLSAIQSMHMSGQIGSFLIRPPEEGS